VVKKEEPKLDNIIEKYWDISVELFDFGEIARKIGTNESKIKGLESSFGILITERYLKN